MKMWFSSIIEKKMVKIIQNHLFLDAFITVEIVCFFLQIGAKY